jgi:hypothetical protein
VSKVESKNIEISKASEVLSRVMHFYSFSSPCVETSMVIGSPRSNSINVLFMRRWKFNVLAGRLPYEIH